MAKYQEPDRFTKQVFNPLAVFLMRFGLSLRGSRVLAVRGRKTGAWHTTPVNPLPFEGARYLVAPRGNTQWVRNIRVAGGGELRLGRKREPIRVVELADDEKPRLLRAYLKLWAWETGKFFGGVTDQAPDEELRRIAPDHPVFRIVDATPG
ncbi:MAG TPA: nitroreductase/quinone reductase family protein [Dehalococcoidia bacterium]|nr:nitroreductase/quinone reductase family protein [Dehalococcoidia bacterium]